MEQQICHYHRTKNYRLLKKGTENLNFLYSIYENKCLRERKEKICKL